MRDSKVVIRINCDALQQQKEIIDPKLVTVWHVRRIIVAVLLVVALLGGLLNWLIGDNTQEQAPVIISQTPVAANVSNEPPPTPVTQVQPALTPPAKAAVIFDKHVMRAAVVKSVIEGQPGESWGSNIQIASQQNVQVFYFSQVKNMKDHVLFHQWKKDGRLIIKKRLGIRDNKAKLVSSKQFTAKDVGQWQVILVDEKNKVFSEANFVVNQ